MFVLAQFVLASLLIAMASSMVLLYLSLFVLSFTGQSGLMPWVEAGMVLYGVVFITFAAMVGVPGILWANHLVRFVEPKRQRISKIPGWIGTVVLVMGLCAAVTLLVREQFRVKSKYDGCILYRDPAAKAAMVPRGVWYGLDCPVEK